MTKKTVYIDTSVYFGFIVGQDNTLGELIEGSHVLCSSTLLFAETQRNIVSYLRNARISDVEFKDMLEIIRLHSRMIMTRALDLELSMDIVFPPVSLPKTLDLIHLRTARWFFSQYSDLLFLSLDIQQNRAALEMNLKLYPR